jgi:hypothetical protein
MYVRAIEAEGPRSHAVIELKQAQTVAVHDRSRLQPGRADLELAQFSVV